MGAQFARAIAMMAAIASAKAATVGDFSARQAALAGVGPYTSQGKRKTKHHDRGGSRAYQRAALKARNVKRSRHAAR